MKKQHYNKAVDVFIGSKVKVTSKGKWHLGAVIDSETLNVSYTESLVEDWMKQLELLCINIAESGAQSAYSAFAGGFKGKVTYFLYTSLPCTAPSCHFPFKVT